MAGVFRGLSEVPGSGEGWPGRLLGEYAQLHLLARAHQRLDALPPDLAATVRSRIGYPTSRARTFSRSQAVTDHWAVLGVRDLLDGNVPGRRVWLRGRDTGRWAMLLTFAAPGGAGGAARLAGPGHRPAAIRDRAPREPALLPRPARAARGRGGAARPAGLGRRRPQAGGDVAALLAGYAEGLEQDPWLTVLAGGLLTGIPVPPDGGSRAPGDGGSRAPGDGSGRGPGDGGREGDRPRLVDRTGAALPLAERAVALDAAGRVRRAPGHGRGRVAPGRPAAPHGLAPRPGGGRCERVVR